MTLYDKIYIVDEKIKVMYNKLYTILEGYNISINQEDTFTNLIKKIETIPGPEFYYRDNLKPNFNIKFKNSDSLLRKEINIYYKIQYLTDYLTYVLLLKGIPRRYIDNCNNLNELIDLVNLINTIKSPTLTIDVQTYDYYYNSYINLPYTLVDEDNNPINDGYIIVLEDDIEIARIPAGYELKFLPSDVGTFTYTFYYSGTDYILPSEQQEYIFNILPPALRLSVDGVNIGDSEYKNNKHIGYDEDIFKISVNTINPYINAPLVNIPFTIIVPQEHGDEYYNGITDLNGECDINIQSSKIDTFDIIIRTTNTNENISNTSATYDLTIYHNPIKIDDYVFGVNQVNKEMEIFCYDKEGILTNNYYTSSYQIIQKYNNVNYRTYNLANKSNPFIINETHEEIDKYNYIYQLYQGNKLICTTTNTVRIKREINIELIPVDKFIENNTVNIPIYIYVTDFLDNPLPNITLRLIDSYHGLRSGTYTTNNKGLISTTINISDILNTPCNGFLLQAIILEEDNQDICRIVADDYSNAVYYRINNDEELSTHIIINTNDTYNLKQLSFNAIFTIYDSEGERVLQPISRVYLLPSTSIPISSTSNVIDGSIATINLDTNTYEGIIGDDLTLSAEYDGEEGFFDNSVSNKNIIFIKSDVEINTTLPSFTVYDKSDLTITLIIPDVNSKYITGDVEINIDEDTYPTTRNNNIYTTSIIPTNAKQTQLSINYSGNKYTNLNVINYPININKTNKYTLDCNLSSNNIFIFESIIFSPTLVGTTETPQEFNGTVTYQFSNGESFTRDLNPFTYTLNQAGEQSVSITYNGDNNHYSKTITKTFIVKKLTPTIILSVPDIIPTYKSDIEYKHSPISYSGNDENLRVKIYDNDTIKYNQIKEHDENVFDIITPGNHIIKLQTDETNIYNSLILEKNIQTYDLLEELYKILQDISDESNYTDTYLIAENTEKIFNAIINNTDDYNEDILEGFYNILNHLGD